MGAPLWSLALIAHRANASIILALDLPTLVQEADHIAVVDVMSVRAAWDERHERIYSTIDLKVVEHWKTPVGAGAPSDHLTIVQAGGTVDDITMTVMGMGSFVGGERSLVFLRGPATHAQVVGMTQGKRAMRYESTSRSWLVAPPDLRQTKLVRPPTTGYPPNKPAVPALPGQKGAASSSPPRPATGSTLLGPDSRNLPIDDVRAEIKRLLGTVRP
jgi:hypothetical protein